MPRLPLLLPLSLVVACEAVDDVPSLTLRPVLAEGHGPWAGPAVVWLERDGEVWQEPAAPGDDGTWRLEDASDAEGATLGLLFAERGASLDPLALGDVRAWGRTSPVTLRGDDAPVVPVLLSEPGRVGPFGAVSREQAAIAPAAVVLPDGDVLLFGGSRMEHETTDRAETETQVLRLSRADDDLAFARVGTIPVFGHHHAPRIAATATVVGVDDRPHVLLAGGRRLWGQTATSTHVGYLYDPDAPDADAWTPVQGTQPRSQHAAVPLDDGRVALLGGFGDGPLPGLLTWEIFDPATLGWQAREQVAGVGAVGFGHADLGAAGVAVCGGFFSQVPGVLGPTAGCALLDPGGGPSTRLPDLPAPRALHAMAPLPDGGLLVVGGLTATLLGDAVVEAGAEVLRFDPTTDTWTEVGTLAHPRVLHALVPLPDGRVVILGGLVGLRWFPDTTFHDAVTCAEIYDPTHDHLATPEPCTWAGAGALPVVASAPGAGVFVLAGPGEVEGAFPARAWGLIATGPAPTP